jgi:hypothetical protein
MFQLALGYVIQADREREVADDLRNRHVLRTSDETQRSNRPSSARSATRRAPVRVRNTGA